MKRIAYSVMIFFTSCFGLGQTKKQPENTKANTSFYSLRAQSLDGKEVDFTSLKGKKVLIVNTASKCGFTPQFEDLQKFHEKYGDKVVVIGFPCNQFGGQDPGSNSEIKAFCQKNYGVSFLMMEKTDVKGANQHPVYKWLTNLSENGWNEEVPGWNFCKYLVNENGELTAYFGSSVGPFDKRILTEIEK